jgi:hypothetical protein
MEKYIIELPNFVYPKKALFIEQDGHPNYIANLLYNKLHDFDTASEALMWDMMEFDIPLAKEVEARFNCRTDSKFTKVLAGGYMPTHIDPGRTAVCMFSLTDEPSPVVFFEGEKEIFTHEYTCATIINAKIHHGVPVNTSDRIAFQVNLYLPWEEVIEKHNNGTLWR